MVMRSSGPRNNSYLTRRGGVACAINDFFCFGGDCAHFYTGLASDLDSRAFMTRLAALCTKINDLRKYFIKKYFYTINHKRIALNYFYFSM